MTVKDPKQARSKATITFILEACQLVLNRARLKRFTTNHIAERSGYSIGTLYRYFPSKDAILIKLVQTEIENVDERAQSFFADQTLSCDELIHKIATLEIRTYQNRPLIRRNIQNGFVLSAKVNEMIHDVRWRTCNQLADTLFERDPARFRDVPPIEREQCLAMHIAAVRTAFEAKDPDFDVAVTERHLANIYLSFALRQENN